MDLINYVESLIDRKLAGIEVAARDAITDHVKHMRDYTIVADFVEGYFHALWLLQRDADFIVNNIKHTLEK